MKNDAHKKNGRLGEAYRVTVFSISIIEEKKRLQLYFHLHHPWKDGGRWVRCSLERCHTNQWVCTHPLMHYIFSFLRWQMAPKLKGSEIVLKMESDTNVAYN